MERKKAQVIMLPTTQDSRIFIHDGKLQSCYDGGAAVANDIDWKCQHLYIASDDEIKSGDWVLFGDVVMVATSFDDRVIYDEEGNSFMKYDCKKIIATTDLIKLYPPSTEFGAPQNEEYIPQPSKAFIEKYCKVGGIDEVDIEYNDKGVVLRGRGGERTITIHPIKESWTREEVEMQLQYCVSLFASERGLTPTSVEMKEVNDWTSNWIKENL